ncbi:hypothetical protein MJO28_015046 [Puccinia striiformis f. sp. tritici]|uniref:Uncharacterized protein n=1 Tax=Puccinia striiformis f. sp. tritici TaxID=168172 RepID=A0ACC0DSN4_9BASI|nr:hypothetical protein MJO28_015046 [Puccinia striiformis f. sp. tritici]
MQNQWPNDHYSGPPAPNTHPSFLAQGHPIEGHPGGHPLNRISALPGDSWPSNSLPGESETARVNRLSSFPIDIQFSGVPQQFSVPTSAPRGPSSHGPPPPPIHPNDQRRVLGRSYQSASPGGSQLYSSSARPPCPPNCTCRFTAESQRNLQSIPSPQPGQPCHSQQAPFNSLGASPAPLSVPSDPSGQGKSLPKGAPSAPKRTTPAAKQTLVTKKTAAAAKKTTTPRASKTTTAAGEFPAKPPQGRSSKKKPPPSLTSSGPNKRQRTDLNDQSPMPDGYEDSDEEPADKEGRTPLSPELVASFADEPLDRLRVRAAEHGEYLRLTVKDKLELDEAYCTFQRSVLLITIKNKLHTGPVLSYMSNQNRARGTTNFNYFCKYDEVAGPIHRDSSMPFGDRMVICGELWDKLGQDGRDKWKDDDFLDTIAAKKIADDEAVPLPQRNRPRDRLKLTAWTRKIKRELRQLSHSHQVEGFVVLASRDPDRRHLIAGGSQMAEEFLDMKSSRTDKAHLFYMFVNGQQSVKNLTGKYPTPASKKRPRGQDGDGEDCQFDLGSRKANRAAVRAKLRSAIYKATHGVWTKGWPGTSTEPTLRALGVTLQIQANDMMVTARDFCAKPSSMPVGQTQRILTAFGKGWFRLLGPPAPEADEDGFTVVGGTLSDDESPSPGQAVRKGQSGKKLVKAFPKDSVSHNVVGVIRRERSYTPSDGDSPAPNLNEIPPAGTPGSSESGSHLPLNPEVTLTMSSHQTLSDSRPNPPSVRPQRSCVVSSALNRSHDVSDGACSPKHNRQELDQSDESDESDESDNAAKGQYYQRISISDDSDSDDDY